MATNPYTPEGRALRSAAVKGFRTAEAEVRETERSLKSKIHELAAMPNPNNIDELREALNHIYEITKP